MAFLDLAGEDFWVSGLELADEDIWVAVLELAGEDIWVAVLELDVVWIFGFLSRMKWTTLQNIVWRSIYQ